MKKVTFFYLEACPYCKNARRAMDELKAGDARYRAIEMDWVEESERPEVAERYDYYSVPTMFIGSEKLYEAHKGEEYEECKANVKRVFEAALA